MCATEEKQTPSVVDFGWRLILTNGCPYLISERVAVVSSRGGCLDQVNENLGAASAGSAKASSSAKEQGVFNHRWLKCTAGKKG